MDILSEIAQRRFGLGTQIIQKQHLKRETFTEIFNLLFGELLNLDAAGKPSMDEKVRDKAVLWK